MPKRQPNVSAFASLAAKAAFSPRVSLLSRCRPCWAVTALFVQSQYAVQGFGSFARDFRMSSKVKPTATTTRLIAISLAAVLACAGTGHAAEPTVSGWATVLEDSRDTQVDALPATSNTSEPKSEIKRPQGPYSPATLRRQPASGESMRADGSHANGGCHARVGTSGDDADFAFTIDGQSVAPDGGTNAADSQRCTDVALERADIQIRYDGLNTEPRLNVVAAPDAANRGDAVIFKTHSNYAWQIERGEVRIFAKDTTTRQAPLAIVPVEGGLASWVIPQEVVAQIRHYASLKDDKSKTAKTTITAAPTDLIKESVTYVLRAYDATGRFDETSPKALGVAHMRGGIFNPADLMAVYNGNALEVRNIKVTGGAVLVSGRNVPAGHTVTALGVPVPVDDKGNFAVRQIVPPGTHQIEVAVASPKGVASQFSRSATVPDRDFFYVALADLTAGKNATSGSAALLNPDKAVEYQDKVFLNGRLAFYLKGKIDGETLLTAAADTRDQPFGKLFSNLDSKDPRYLLRNLDPNKYYPVYGDDSTLNDDAPTRGKFYVRLERGDSSIVWGNFKTTITGTEFIRYDRGLYGARAQSKTAAQTSFGERRGQAEVFAAEPGTLGARDVFRGTGGSLYYLRRQNITQGSERIVAEVRDRTSGLVIKTRTLVATQDYEVNYLQGRITLAQPLSAAAENDFVVRSGGFGNNDQFLVVNYEYAPGLQASRDRVVGGRTSFWINDHVQLGVTGYDQTAPGQNLRLLGSDLTVRLSPGSYVKIEGARSNGPGSGESVSIDGGFTFDSRTTTGNKAYAKRVEAGFDLSEIIRGAEGRVAAFWKDKDRDYSGPGELAVNRASREMGIRAAAKINERWSTKTKLDDKQDEFRSYAAGEQNFTYTFNEYWKGTIGARLDNNDVKTPSASRTLNQNGRRTDVAVRADYDSKRDWATYGFVQATVDRTGERDANNRIGIGGTVRMTERLTALAEISEGNGGLGGKVGTEYKIDEKRSSYINYAFDPDRTDIISRGGAGIFTSGARERFSDSFSVFGEERLRHGGGFGGLTHAFGLNFAPLLHWKTGLTFETGHLSDPFSGDVRRNAVSAMLGYSHGGLVYNGKYEFRHDAIETVSTGSSARDTYLMNNSIVMKINPNWRSIAKLNGSYSTSSQGEFYRGDFVEGVAALAYRPVHDDRLNALFKYTYLYDLPSPGQKLGSSAVGNFAQQSHVLSMDGSYDVSALITLGAKYAVRIGELKDNTAGAEWFRSRAQLLIGRVDLHIIKEWDVVGELRTLSASEAHDRKSGALVGVYRHVNDNFKIGVGYNFSGFSDDLTNLNYNNRGVFVNALGKF
jgi:hypothetical protein